MRTKEKLCDYCGEEKAQIQIPNPNMWQEELQFWDVCVTCKKIINAQMELSFGLILKERGNSVAEEMSNKIIERSKKKIDELSYESGKEVFGVELKLNKGLES